MDKTTTLILPNDSARNIAVNALLAFTKENRGIQDTLDEIFRGGKIEGREKRLAGELALGSCRQLITLDHLLEQYSTRPIKRIEPVLMQILRIGLYQLMYLERTPDFAVVDQAVRQANKSVGKGASGFVNAVLRSVQRDMDRTVEKVDSALLRNTIWVEENIGRVFKTNILPDSNKNPAKFYSKAFSHPVWLMDKWLKRYGPEQTREICLANNSRPRLILRVNSLRCTAEDFDRQLRQAGYEVQRAGVAIQLLQPAVPEELPGYQEGLFSVQDLTAMSVAPLVETRPGQRILDLCAAPGGKTTHLAELMRNEGCIVACDVSPAKLKRIEQNSRRLRVEIVQTTLPEELNERVASGGPFDAILADVPCSNTGVFARRVEVRHRIKPVQIQRLAAIQLELLEKAAKMLKPRGRIVYSTCSIEPAENENLVQKFMQKNRGFRLLKQRCVLPGRGAINELQAGEESLRHDGGYAAVLVSE